jgi:hypothetical protein
MNKKNKTKGNNMNKNTVKTAILTLLASAIIAAPTVSRAQDTTNAPAVAPAPAPAPAVVPDQTTNVPAKPKKHEGIPFHGTVSAVDTNAMTLTVKTRTFGITSETRITKDGEPAILSDIAVGDKVSGAYKKSEDGTLDATTIHDGKKKKEDAGMDSTNSVSK